MKKLLTAIILVIGLLIPSTVLATPRDVCSNLPGVQHKIPDGMSIIFYVSDPFTPVCVPEYPLD